MCIRDRTRIEMNRNALTAGMNGLDAHQISAVGDLERNRAVTVDESLAEAELNEPDEDVDGDQYIRDDGDCAAIHVVVAEWHYHDRSSMSRETRTRANVEDRSLRPS